MKRKVGLLIGSLRRDSLNLRLGKALERIGQESFQFEYLNIHDLPLFNQDLEADVPKSVSLFKSQIQSCDAILIITPEYNRSIPGVLKNAIDWASRPYGSNSFAKKPCALIGTSAGTLGTACAQQHLKSIMVYLDTHLMGQPEAYIHFNGELSNPKTEAFLSQYISEFEKFVSQLSASGK